MLYEEAVLVAVGTQAAGQTFEGDYFVAGPVVAVGDDCDVAMAALMSAGADDGNVEIADLETAGVGVGDLLSFLH